METYNTSSNEYGWSQMAATLLTAAVFSYSNGVAQVSQRVSSHRSGYQVSIDASKNSKVFDNEVDTVDFAQIEVPALMNISNKPDIDKLILAKYRNEFSQEDFLLLSEFVGSLSLIDSETIDPYDSYL